MQAAASRHPRKATQVAPVLVRFSAILVCLALFGCRPEAERRTTESLSYGPLPDPTTLRTLEERTAEAERLMMAGQAAMEAGNPTQASRYLRAGLAVQENHEFLWLQLCILSQDIGRPGDAEAACSKAIEYAQDPAGPNYDSLVNRGVARLRLGDLDGAEQDFDRARAQRPEDAEAWYDASWVHAARGDLDRVIEHVRAAGARDPYYRRRSVVGDDHPFDRFKDEERWTRFLATLDQGAPGEEKITTLLETRGLSGVPGSEEAMIAGEGEIDAGRVDAALEHLRRGLAIDDRNSALWLQYCIASAEGGDHAEAERACGRAIDTAADPTQPNFDALLGRALARLRLGRPDTAAPDFQQLQAQHPDNAEAWYHGALLRAAQGDVEAVVIELRRAGSLDPVYASPDLIAHDPAFRRFEGDRRWERFVSELSPPSGAILAP